MIFIYSTFPNKKDALRIGGVLLQKKLAACCNIFPIDSIYSWGNKIEKDREFVVLIKTKKANFKTVEKFILKNHKYDTPCVIEIPLGRVSQGYLSWLEKNISKPA